jgi:hypothetical protein
VLLVALGVIACAMVMRVRQTCRYAG